MLKAGLAIAGIGSAISIIRNAVSNALKVQIKFEQSIANVASVSGGATDELEKLARAAGKSTVFSASEAADAMYLLASAGLDVKDMGKTLKPVLNLAAAAQIGLAEATDLVVSQLKVYQRDMEDAEYFTDIMAQTVRSSNTNMQQLGNALGYASSSASTAGISFEDLNAMIASMADLGIKGARAGVQIRQAIARLIAPTGEARDLLEKYNIQVSKLPELIKDPIKLFGMLKDANISQSDALKILGVRQADVYKLIRDGVPRMKELRAAMDEAGGAAQLMADVQIKTLDGSLKILKSRWEELILTFSKNQSLRQAVDLLAMAVTEITSFFKGGEDLDEIANDLINTYTKYNAVLKAYNKAVANGNDLQATQLEIQKQQLAIQLSKQLQELDESLGKTTKSFNVYGKSLLLSREGVEKEITSLKELKAKFADIVAIAEKRIQEERELGKTIKENNFIVAYSKEGDISLTEARKKLATVSEDILKLEQQRLKWLGANDKGIQAVAKAIVDRIITENDLLAVSQRTRELILNRVEQLKAEKKAQDAVNKSKKEGNKTITPTGGIDTTKSKKASAEEYYSYILTAEEQALRKEEERYQKAVQYARQKGISIEAITQAHLNKQDEIKDAHLQKELEKDYQKLTELELYLGNKNQIELEKEYERYEQMQMIAEEQYNRGVLSKEQYEMILDQITDQHVQNRIQMMSNEFSQGAAFAKNYTTQVGALTNSMLTLQLRAIATKEAADGKTDVEGRKRAKALWTAQKALSISQSIMNTAVAAVKALTIDPTGILTALTIAAGVAQTAVIASEPPPFATGGLINGPSHGAGGVPATVAGNRNVELEGGEYIMRRSAVSFYGKDFMDRLNAMHFQEGGAIPVDNSSIANDNSVSMQIDNIEVPNATNAQELMQQMVDIAYANNKRILVR